ncbi:MAG: hypothetical protein PHQ40_11855 [Anaerolineaceae bacterium]|nr:hypothetical protein [Anaerolineaceae bacterium]
MLTQRHSNAKQLIAAALFLATLFLFLGLFLSAVHPVSAEGGISGTGTSVVPVTGNAGVSNQNAIDLNQLLSYTVVDRDGMQIGRANTFVLDLRNASVCSVASSNAGNASASVSATATSTGAMEVSGTAAVPNTGSAIMGLKDCAAPSAGQASGAIAYVIVDRSATTSASSGTTSSFTSTPEATSPEGASVPGTSMVATPSATNSSISTSPMSGNLVPVPWRFIRINLDQHTLIVDATNQAFNTAPGYSSSESAPDFFGTLWQTGLTRFWNNSANVSAGGIPNTGGAAQATSMLTATSTKPSSETSTVAATTAATKPAMETGTVAPTSTVVATRIVAATSTAGATSSVPATVQAPGVSGSPTALVPVTGIDLGQVQEEAAAQHRMILDVGIVGVGLILLAVGIVLKTGKK